MSLACAWGLGAALGEGPVWVARERALWFVDIKGRHLHRYDPQSGERRSVDAPGQCGFLLPAADGSFIAGVQGGLHRFAPDTGRFSLLTPVEADRPGNRLNDGVVDPSGHLWFGSMDDAESFESGRFYRLDDDGVVRPRGFGCAITNGPAFSPDGRVGYFVDTLGRKIWACDVDANGALSGQRLFVDLGQGPGWPDGPTVDEQGFVWLGLYGGWSAQRYSPAGVLVETLDFPVANVTKVAFGGPERRTLFATTASQNLTADERARQPLAGGLFTATVTVPGLAGALIRHGI